jgi:hypothetical protein
MEEDRYPASEYPQITQERLILRVSRVLCRLKIAEEQRDYLYSLISEKVPELVARDISFHLDEIYLRRDEEYNSKTNEQTLQEYPKESSLNVFIMNEDDSNDDTDL